MLTLDENALICDLAETYQIYDYRSLPVFTVAALSAGLRDNSRIMTKLRGGELVSSEHILAMIYDLLVIRFTGKREAAFMEETIIGKPKPVEAKKKTKSFDSTDEFDRAREKAMREY